MKTIIKSILSIGSAAILLASCTQILEEHPKTIYTPDYFTTKAGIEGGLTALYSHLRDTYGDPYTWADLEGATDECTYSEAGFKGSDFSTGAHVTADNCPKSGFWSFTYINTANGIIENASKANMDESLIAEAKFFRALYYFNMVQVFGGCPLDLGSGELAFNSSAVRTSSRNTVPEVYDRCIIPDLLYAYEFIPETPRVGGAISKTAVRILLSKAYLTYGWWQTNPKGLPTYPECPRQSSIQGLSASGCFQKAYDLAYEGITATGIPYGLESSYYKVHAGKNDYNKEQVFYADHTENSTQYNGGSGVGDSLGSGPNYVSWFLQWNYPNMQAITNTGTKITPVYRVDNQFLGRPWERLAPTHEALQTFTDVDMDSRWDGTFSWLYRTNWNQKAETWEYVEGPNGSHIGLKEPFLVFENFVDEDVIYGETATTKDLGYKEGVPYYVVDLRSINRNVYPGLWKQGPYRTNTSSAPTNNDPKAIAGIGEQNAPSTRPYIIFKFSELYFVAAEANIMGASPKDGYDAYKLINVIRARAGKWEFKNNEQEVYVADFSEELCAKTPNPVTLDFLLDEYMREFFGEGRRWFDLARTQQWLERAATYTISETTKSHTPKTLTRDIIELNYMNPVPQGQINSMKMSDEEKKAYQTPGYWLD